MKTQIRQIISAQLDKSKLKRAALYVLSDTYLFCRILVRCCCEPEDLGPIGLWYGETTPGANTLPKIDKNM